MFSLFKKGKPIEKVSKPEEQKLPLSDTDIKFINSRLTKARTEYISKHFPKFKSRYKDWFKENPKVFTPSKDEPYYSKYDDYASIRVIVRDTWELTGPNGKHDSRRLLTGNYEDVEVARKAEQMADEFFTIHRELIKDVKDKVTPLLNGLDIKSIDDEGDWDDGSIDVNINGLISSESVSMESMTFDEIIREATRDDRIKEERLESVKESSGMISELWRGVGLESWFSSNEPVATKNVTFDQYPKLQPILEKAQKDILKNYKSLPGYKESKKMCREEYDDDLFIEKESIYMHRNSVYLIGFTQDGLTNEYISSLRNLMTKYVNEIKDVYPDLDPVVDVNDDGTDLEIMFD